MSQTNGRRTEGSPDPRPDPLALAVVGFASFAYLGLLLVDGFAENFYSELAGVALSIILAVFIVDKLIQRNEERRWSRVRWELLQSIQTSAQFAALDFYLAQDADKRRAYPPPVVVPLGQTPNVLRATAASLRLRVNDSPPERDHKAVLRLQVSVGEKIQQIIDRLNIAVNAANDPILVSLFGKLVEANFQWKSARTLYGEDHPEQLWEDAARMAEALADLDEYAFDHLGLVQTPPR